MKGKVRATWAVILVATLIVAMPASAVVIEDIVTHHPLVAFVSSWGASEDTSHTNLSVSPNDDNGPLSPELRDLPSATGVATSTDNITVEIVPLRFPKLPASVVFAFYLVGALVFYTLLVLIAQPGPSEYY